MKYRLRYFTLNSRTNFTKKIYDKNFLKIKIALLSNTNREFCGDYPLSVKEN